MGKTDRSRKVKGRIIKAAMEVFAEKGFEGARIDVIAQRTGINKSMLYYHIGDKEDLYHFVLRSVITETAEQIESALSQLVCPVEKLSTYIRIFVRSATNNPDMAPIMMRELSSGSVNLPLDIALIYERTIDILKKTIDEGIREGSFIACSPLLVYVMITGCLVMYRLTDSLRKRVVEETSRHNDMEDYEEETINAEIEHLIMKAVMKREKA